MPPVEKLKVHNKQSKQEPDMDPADKRDPVLMGILKSLLMLQNTPQSPKELARFMLDHRETVLDNRQVLGGKTPFATVSSRLSQHFKRSRMGKRRPLFVKVPVGNRKFKYRLFK